MPLLIASLFLAVVVLSVLLVRTRAAQVKAVSEARNIRRVLSSEPLGNLEQVELQLFRCRSYLTRRDQMLPSNFDNLARRSVLQTANLRIGQAIDHLHIYRGRS